MERDRPTHCHLCGCNFKAVGHLSFNSRHNIEVTVPIYKNAVLYDYHINDSTDFNTPAGQILMRNKRFGLQNLSNKNWQVTKPDNEQTTVPAGKGVILKIGYKIDFGGIVATVKANA